MFEPITRRIRGGRRPLPRHTSALLHTSALALFAACSLLGCGHDKSRKGTQISDGFGGSGATSSSDGNTSGGGDSSSSAETTGPPVEAVGGSGGSGGAGGEGGEGPYFEGADIERVSVSSDGEEGNSSSQLADVSDDGRFVVFLSWATNLVSTVTTDYPIQVYLRDVEAKTTTLLSEPDRNAYLPSISGDGRFVAFIPGGVSLRDLQNETTTTLPIPAPDGEFVSLSYDARYVAFSSQTRLVDEDDDNVDDIFVYDREMDETTIASISSDGEVGSIHSRVPTLSPDGRYVAFESLAPNLVDDDTNDSRDIFVHDRDTGTTTLVSRNSDGTPGDDDSYNASISADGRYVVFQSNAENLVDDDTNGNQDVFVHDLEANTTTRVSVSSDGREGNSTSELFRRALSNDGRYAVFSSMATSLVHNDFGGPRDVFLRDLERGSTTLLHVNANGVQGAGLAEDAVISGSGNVVVFMSDSPNLVKDDENGALDIFLLRLR